MRRRAVKAGLVGFNIVLLIGVIGVLLLNPSRTGSTLQAAASTANVPVAMAPVDQLTSVSVALTVARMANLPEAQAVANQADSASIQLAVASSNSTVVNKPQEVSSAFLSNKDIASYVTQDNDTVSSVAAKYGVSSDSILWSNNLVSSILPAGKQLYIPPTNGIVYVVKSGDTAGSLAAKYHADADKITAINDAEVGGLSVGERIIIPDGKVIAAPVYSTSYNSGSGFAWGAGAIYGFNGYDYGNCTWYVATQISVPANWGNADTWAAGARAAGWHVSSVPTVGAVAQTSAGSLGHVGIVRGVNGGQVWIWDMNNYGDGGGYGAVGKEWVPASAFQNYITAP